MSAFRIDPDMLAGSGLLCDIRTVSGVQTLLVFVDSPRAVGSGEMAYEARALCCGPLSDDAGESGIWRRAVVVTTGFAGTTGLLVAPGLDTDTLVAAGGFTRCLLDFYPAFNVRPVTAADGVLMPVGVVDDGPCTCPECSSDDLTALIPVPLEAYRIALAQCAVAYKSSLDNGFDPEFVTHAVDQAVEETLMEHIERHFADMAESACSDDAGDPVE